MRVKSRKQELKEQFLDYHKKNPQTYASWTQKRFEAGRAV